MAIKQLVYNGSDKWKLRATNLINQLSVGSSYVAGFGIDITENTISVNEDVATQADMSDTINRVDTIEEFIFNSGSLIDDNGDNLVDENGNTLSDGESLISRIEALERAVFNG